MRPRAGLLAGLLLVGCEVEEWRNADLQLEVVGAALDTQDIVRICIDDVGSRDVALGAGRVAYPGVPPEGAVTVTVDVLAPDSSGDTGGGDSGSSDAVRLGRAGPVSFETVAHAEVAWVACTDDCTPCRQADVEVGEGDTRLLAVRFQGLD